MNFTNIPLFHLMQQKMEYHSARQAVLAQNVANSDTPNYRAQDIKAPDFGAYVKSANGGVQLAQTHPQHMPIKNKKINMRDGLMQRENTYEMKPIGNNVVIEEEVMKVAENQSEYQKSIGIYRKSIEMFRIALGRGGGG